MMTSVMRHKLPWYRHWSFWFVASQQLWGDSWPIAAKGPPGTLTSGGPTLLTHRAMQLELHTHKYTDTCYWNLLRDINQSLMYMHAFISLWQQLVTPLDGTKITKNQFRLLQQSNDLHCVRSQCQRRGQFLWFARGGQARGAGSLLSCPVHRCWPLCSQ